MEMLKRYAPMAIVALLVYVAYDYYKKQRASKLASASTDGASA